MFIHKQPRLRCHPCRLFPFSLLRPRASVPSYPLSPPTRRFSHPHFFFVLVVVVVVVVVVDNHDDDYDYDGDVQHREQNVATPPTPLPRINLVSLSFSPLSLSLPRDPNRLSLSLFLSLSLPYPYSAWHTLQEDARAIRGTRTTLIVLVGSRTRDRYRNRMVSRVPPR